MCMTWHCKIETGTPSNISVGRKFERKTKYWNIFRWYFLCQRLRCANRCFLSHISGLCVPVAGYQQGRQHGKLQFLAFHSDIRFEMNKWSIFFFLQPNQSSAFDNQNTTNTKKNELLSLPQFNRTLSHSHRDRNEFVHCAMNECFL